MNDQIPPRWLRAYLEATRGILHPWLGTDAAYADMVADRLAARVGGRFASFTLEPHGPVQWLQAAPPAAPARHESARLFAPVDVMRGQTGMDI
jgi:hypothetical protein